MRSWSVAGRALVPVVVSFAVGGCAWIGRASESAPPDPVGGNSDSALSSLSSTGRFVALESNASNLVPGDTNGATDVFVKDMSTGVIERASVSSDGTQLAGGGKSPAISDDGRYVAFISYEVPFPITRVNGSVSVRDRQMGTTRNATLEVDLGGDNGDIRHLVMSGDGQTIAFEIAYRISSNHWGTYGAWVYNFGSGSTRRLCGAGFVEGSLSLSNDGARAAFIRSDFTGGCTAAVVRTADGTSVRDLPCGSSGSVTLSGDGSRAAIAIPDGANKPKIVVYRISDGASSTIARVNLDGAAVRVFGISDDGGRVLYGVPRGAGYAGFVASADGSTPLRRIDTDANLNPADWAAFFSLSGDGKWVSFGSADPDLVAVDGNVFVDVFVRSVDPSARGPR